MNAFNHLQDDSWMSADTSSPLWATTQQEKGVKAILPNLQLKEYCSLYSTSQDEDGDDIKELALTYSTPYTSCDHSLHRCPRFVRIRLCDEFKGLILNGRIPLLDPSDPLSLTIKCLPRKADFERIYRAYIAGNFTRRGGEKGNELCRIGDPTTLICNHHEVAWRLFEAVILEFGEKLDEVSMFSVADSMHRVVINSR